RSTRGAAIAVLTAMALIPATLSAASAAETSTPLADRVLVLREGRVVHTSPAQELDEHRVLDLVMEGSPTP
ncbi:hypothetical protein AB0R12_26290, partial [Streptomyces niveus]